MTMTNPPYPLRLPRLLKAAVENLSERDGMSPNQFVVIAVAEKVSAMVTADRVIEDNIRADMAAFDRIMSCGGGAGGPTLSGDERPRSP